jgi:hypothetical protein
MAKFGLLPLARMALNVLKVVLPALPKPFQQASIQPTAVAGHSLHALRGLALSRSPEEYIHSDV